MNPKPFRSSSVISESTTQMVQGVTMPCTSFQKHDEIGVELVSQSMATLSIITTALSTIFHLLVRYLFNRFLNILVFSSSSYLSHTLVQPPLQSLQLCVNIGIFRQLFLQSSLQATCPLPTSLRSRLKPLPPR